MNPQILMIDGWMAPVELNWLYQVAAKVPINGLIIEIGAWKGRSSAAIYSGAGEGKRVVSVDTWKGQEDLPDHQIAKDVDLLEVYKDNMNSLGFHPEPLHSLLANGIYYHVCDSVESSKLFDDESVDWIFIDGDHRKCGEDIDAWLPKMKPNGLITGHDYFCFYETIQQEIHKRFWVHEIHHSIWVRYTGNKRPGWYK